MITEAVLTCPHCGAQSEQSMPLRMVVDALDCPACGARVEAGEAHCAFCAHADAPCPVAQTGLGCCGND